MRGDGRGALLCLENNFAYANACGANSCKRFAGAMRRSTQIYALGWFWRSLKARGDIPHDVFNFDRLSKAQ